MGGKAKSLKSLAGTIAHEIRNPLNTISLTQNQIKELLTDPVNSANDNKEKFKVQIKNWINNFLNGNGIQADIRFLSIEKNGI